MVGERDRTLSAPDGETGTVTTGRRGGRPAVRSRYRRPYPTPPKSTRTSKMISRTHTQVGMPAHSFRSSTEVVTRRGGA